MLRIKGILATSHLDSGGGRIAPQALKQFADMINSCIMPMGVEHDPRIPPQGRLTSARFVRMEDGAYAVEGEGVVFEPGEVMPLEESELSISLKAHKLNELDITFDGTFRDANSQKVIREIGELFNTKPQEEFKKSIDPLSVLIVGGAFVLGGIGNGFLTKLGEDAYGALKAKLKQLMEMKNTTATERLLVFETSIEHDGGLVNCEVILTNPTDDDIDEFLGSTIRQLDAIMANCLSINPAVSRWVFAYEDKRLHLQFGVRKDAVPVFLKEGSRDLSD